MEEGRGTPCPAFWVDDGMRDEAKRGPEIGSWIVAVSQLSTALGHSWIWRSGLGAKCRTSTVRY